MTDEKRKLIYKMFDSIGHEVRHRMEKTVRGDIIWKYENRKDYINLINSSQPKCVIYDYRKNAKHDKLLLPSYLN